MADNRRSRLGPWIGGTALWLACAAVLAGINTWTPVSPAGESIGVFAVDPRNPERLYAGTVDPLLSGKEVGILRSADRGRTWQFAPLGTLEVTGVAVDPADSSVVYAATVTGGLFRSDDYGATWTLTRADGFEQSLSLVVDPSNAGTLYVAVGHSPVFVFMGDSICRSSDGGRSYDRCHGFANGSRVTSILVDPIVSARVYACVDGQIWMSTDAGSQWTLLGGLPPGGYANLAIRSIAPPAMYTDGVIRSLNAGQHWDFFGAPPLGRGPILPDPLAEKRVLVGGQGGVCQTLDGGSTWAPLTTGFPATRVTQLAFDASDTSTVLAIGGASLYRMTITDRGLACSADARTLCLNDGRFQVTLSWTTGDARGFGNAAPLTEDTGAFWFFSSNNLELAIKVVDGRAVNGRFWVFAAGLTDVAYDVTVTDVKTGLTWTHVAPAGRLESYADTNAFGP